MAWIQRLHPAIITRTGPIRLEPQEPQTFLQKYFHTRCFIACGIFQRLESRYSDVNLSMRFNGRLDNTRENISPCAGGSSPPHQDHSLSDQVYHLVREVGPIPSSGPLTTTCARIHRNSNGRSWYRTAGSTNNGREQGKSLTATWHFTSKAVRRSGMARR